MDEGLRRITAEKEAEKKMRIMLKSVTKRIKMNIFTLNYPKNDL